MKSYGQLYDQICSFENLLLAARKAQRGKRFRENVGRFNLGLERELLALQEELRGQTYRPGKYREFKIFRPKERMISAAPYRDRVVHHALCNVIEPLFDRTFIEDSYACRKGKGTHRAVDRLTGFCRRSRYALQCDIRKYFPSIDHEILLGLISRKIRDRQVLGLIRVILDASNPQEPVPDLYFEGDDPVTALSRRRGIPIGNLTSQFFANLYLNGLDHFLKEELGCRHYLRYMDDLVALDNDKGWLHWVKEEIRVYLAGLRLRPHAKKCRIFPIREGIELLGYRVYPDHRRLRRDNVVAFRRRLKRLQEAYGRGEIDLEKLNQSIRSWIAHASHADTYGLRRRIFEQAVFRKEAIPGAEEHGSLEIEG